MYINFNHTKIKRLMKLNINQPFEIKEKNYSFVTVFKRPIYYRQTLM